MGATLGLVVSPTAGSGRGVTLVHHVRRALVDRGYRVIPLGAPTITDTHDLIASAVATKLVDGIVTIGGDGTIHLALQHLVHTNIFLGHIPLGTGNDIGRDLGLTTRWETGLDILLDALAHRVPTPVDVLKITGGHGTRYGLAVVSAGLDAIVNQKANTYTRPHGHARYLRAVAAELPTYRPRTYRITTGGKTATGEAIVVAVANLRSIGGGLTLSPHSCGTDGQLELLIAKSLSVTEVLRIFPRLYEGTHVDEDFVHVIPTTDVTIEAVGRGVSAMVDGEEIGPLPVTVRVEPDALLFLR